MELAQFAPRKFHEGELFVQKKRSVLQEADDVNEMVQPILSPMSAVLFRSARFVAVATIDSDKNVWAHAAYGEPGFFRAHSESQVFLNPTHNRDVLMESNLKVGAPYATLLVDLETRKRFRVNGEVSEIVPSANGPAMLLGVKEAYPNCPKYIQKRVVREFDPQSSKMLPGDISVSKHLNPEQVAFIKRADTFFIATYHETAGADVSHRGGNQGFVRVISDREIMWADYRGNNLFMSLGNLIVNRNCGLLFIDFETGAALQLTGKAEVVWDDNLSVDTSPIDLVFRVFLVRSVPYYSPLRYKLVEPSPFNPQLRDHSSLGSLILSHTRSAQLIAVTNASSLGDVKTFRFKVDKPLLPPPVPGQYITLRFALNNGPLVERTWTLSSAHGATGADEFEISIKRKDKGVVSAYLHNTYSAHDVTTKKFTVEVAGVGGDFTPLIDPSSNGNFALQSPQQALLFLAGGIGVTPYVSILRHLATRSFPVPTYLIISNKQLGNTPFLSEFQAMESKFPDQFHLCICTTQEASVPSPHHAGRMTAEVISKFAPNYRESHTFVCGPEPYIQHSLSLLTDLGVPLQSVSLERFDF